MYKLPNKYGGGFMGNENYNDEISNNELHLLIGEQNTLYYLLSSDYYKENPNSFKPRWNLGALIGGTFWLAYRKMYLESLISIGIVWLLDLFMPLNMGWYIVMFLICMYGDKVYYEHMKRKYKKVKSSILDKESLDEKLKKIGGTNRLIVVLAVIIVGYFIIYKPIGEMNKIMNELYDSI